MDCFDDFCLNCDRQTWGSPYCSQRCHIADLNKAGSQTTLAANTSIVTGPTTRSETYALSPHASSDEESPVYFNYARGILPPNKFHSDDNDADCEQARSRAYRSLSSCSSQSSISNSSTHNHHHHQYQYQQYTPCCSPAGGGSGLSEMARQQLNQYAQAFDQTREQRRPSCPTLKNHEPWDTSIN